jgi:hypothetical protein
MTSFLSQKLKGAAARNLKADFPSDRQEKGRKVKNTED